MKQKPGPMARVFLFLAFDDAAGRQLGRQTRIQTIFYIDP